MLCRFQLVFQFEGWSVRKQISVAIFVLYQVSKQLNVGSGTSTKISCAFEIESESGQLRRISMR